VKPGAFSISAGRTEAACQRALRRLERNAVLPRIMVRDAGLFSRQPAVRDKIANRLGWVDVAGTIRKRVAAIESFGHDVIKAGFRDVVLLGMGGSSLCPDLFGRIFGRHRSLDSFAVLDSTDPRAVTAALRKVQLDRTLFIVSSKSGATVETRSQMICFLDRLRQEGFSRQGRQFVAITDSDSALHSAARSEGFRRIYLNPPDIGGRYSALSYFGLVPGFFAGVNLAALLDDAYAMEKILRARDDETNPAAALAALMAAGAESGSDKMTFIASRGLAPLVPWIEQLVAESTGKKTRGVVPIDGEPLGAAADYRDDRMFVTLRLASEKPPLPENLRAAFRKKGFPIVDLSLPSYDALGGQFLLWEVAVAAAGYLMGINPFDEPNVTESKRNTERILDQYRESGQFADLAAGRTYGRLTLVSHGGESHLRPSDLADLKRLLTRFLAGLRPPEYVALLCYSKEERALDRQFAGMRAAIRRRRGVATLCGYGPRYLHSIGQLYKGGPDVGRFIVFLRADYDRLEIPGRFYDFGQLITAQAIGDVRALASRDLPVLVFAVKGNVTTAVKEFADVLHAVCQ